MSPALEGTDQALESGSLEAQVKLVRAGLSAGIRARFASATEKKHLSEATLEAGQPHPP